MTKTKAEEIAQDIKIFFLSDLKDKLFENRVIAQIDAKCQGEDDEQAVLVTIDFFEAKDIERPASGKNLLLKRAIDFVAILGDEKSFDFRGLKFEPIFIHEENDLGLLNRKKKSFQLESILADEVIEAIYEWIVNGRLTIDMFFGK